MWGAELRSSQGTGRGEPGQATLTEVGAGGTEQRLRREASLKAVLLSLQQRTGAKTNGIQEKRHQEVYNTLPSNSSFLLCATQGSLRICVNCQRVFKTWHGFCRFTDEIPVWDDLLPTTVQRAT